MNLANIIKRLHVTEKNLESAKKQVSSNVALVDRLKHDISRHVESPKEGESPVVISLRYGIFGRKTYLLRPDGSTTRSHVIEESR